jgi:hypothetical protein
MSLCGLASVAAAGRMLFAFSRDTACPARLAAQGLASLSAPRPTRSFAIVVFSYILTNAAFIFGGATAIAIVTAISTIALYWAYGVPIFLGVFGKQEWREHAVWRLGRFSKPIGRDRGRLDRSDLVPVPVADVRQRLHAGSPISSSSASCSSTTSPGPGAASRARSSRSASWS